FQQQLKKTLQKFPDNAQLYLMLADYYQRKNEIGEAEKNLKKAIEIQSDSIPFRQMLANFYRKQKQFDKAEAELKRSGEEFPENIQLKVALAELQFDVKKFDDARTLMDSILASNPSNGGANLIKARFLIKEGKIKEAMEIISPLTNDYPKWADPFYYSALTHLRTGQTDLAKQSISQALQNDPGNDRYHALAAQISLVRGDSNDAGKEATIALRLNPKNFTAVKILAKSFVQSKEYDKAIKLIEGVQNQVGENVDLISSLSMAYLGKNEREKAKDSLARLLEIAPDNSRALAYFAALSSDNDTAKSIAIVEKQIEKSKTGGHYLLLGELYAKNKQVEKALDALLKAQQLNPDNPQAYMLRANLLRQEEQTDRAIDEYNALLEKNPDSVVGNMGLATVYDSRGEHAKAKELYMKVLKLRPDFATAANNLAWLLASEEGGDLGEALRLAMQAKQALPSQPHIADTLGWVHYKRKSYSLATSQFQQALEKRPDDPTILYHLALAQYGNGKKDKAVASLEKALGSDAVFGDRAEAEGVLAGWK
ncbi:MAG: tetratricopeptide repeat protein, partial [Deltaproteobacteria bacterium]|nr:tetratricopeptide repeat protein [Deltaproteobacteria bacterium]